ncbi:MAG: DUF4105 domain-containing protein [Bacteroidales bacterium]|nr:DUF4105 domain-containing protein [Bacteroidales bacterium]
MRAKSFFVWVCLFCSTLMLHAQLSQSAKVSVLTCGAGEEFYEAFGHTAIRIVDDSLLLAEGSTLDLVFNYGIFNFDVDNFYFKFAKGQLLYELGVSTFDNFLFSYQYEQRSVNEQVLALNAEQKNALYQLLVENYLPENRYYSYDFFRDNCATRVRDILQKAIGKPVFETKMEVQPATFRSLYYLYTDSLLWWRLGIDIALGARTDKQITTWDYLYLPNCLENQLDTLVFAGQKGGLVSEKQQLSAQLLPPPNKALITPDILFWGVLVLTLILCFWEIKKGFYAKAFDILLFTLLSVLSVLVIFLWFFSDHYATKDNFNLLWANPLAIAILFMLKKTPVWLIGLYAICLIVSFGCFGLLPQQFNSTVLPILLIIMSRLFGLANQKKHFIL